MAGESQEIPNSPPDPSVLTTEQMLREVAHAEILAAAYSSTITQRITDMKQMLDERYDTQTKAVDKALTAQQTAMQTAFAAADKAIDRQRVSDQEAVDKALEAAEKAVDRRQDQLDKEFHEHLEQVRHENRLALESVNKLYGERFDSSDKAISKAEAANEKRFEAVNEFRAQLADQSNTFIPREVAEATFKELRSQIGTLTTRLDTQQGRSSGYNALYGWLIAGVGLLITIILLANTVLSQR